MLFIPLLLVPLAVFAKAHDGAVRDPNPLFALGSRAFEDATDGNDASQRSLSQAIAAWSQSESSRGLHEDAGRFSKLYYDVAQALMEAGAAITYEQMKMVIEQFGAPQAPSLLKAMVDRAPGGINIQPPANSDPKMSLLCIAILQKAHANPLVELLLSWNAQLDSGPDDDGYQPIHVAAAVGDRAFTTFLLDQGVDINRAGPRGITALYLASRNGDVNLVSFLLQRGAQVNTPGNSPLHGLVLGAYEYALGLGLARSQNIEGSGQFVSVAEILLAAGAERSARNQDGSTPLDLVHQMDCNGLVDDVLMDRLRGGDH